MAAVAAGTCPGGGVAPVVPHLDAETDLSGGYRTFTARRGAVRRDRQPDRRESAPYDD
jgi:hypothetical protein